MYILHPDRKLKLNFSPRIFRRKRETVSSRDAAHECAYAAGRIALIYLRGRTDAANRSIFVVENVHRCGVNSPRGSPPAKKILYRVNARAHRKWNPNNFNV